MAITITDAQYAGRYSSNKVRSRIVTSCSAASSTNNSVTLTLSAALQVYSSTAGTTIGGQGSSQDVYVYVDDIEQQVWLTGWSSYSTKCTSASTWYTAQTLTKSVTLTKGTSTQAVKLGNARSGARDTSTTINPDYSYVDFYITSYPSASNTLYTIPKKSYTIAYNANGGSGAPASQTKTHGTSITLSTATPTRDGYSFAGWNTKSDGSGTSYAAGATFTSNANTTLYAKWTAIVSTLTIGTVKAIRVADSASTTEADEGECAYVTVAYTAKGAAAATISLAATCKDDQNNSKTCTVSSSQSKSANTDKTGTFTVRASTLDIEKRYTFALTVSAAVTGQTTKTASKSVVLPMAFFTLDVLAGGHGMGIGKPATRETLDIGMPVYVDNIVQSYMDSARFTAKDTGDCSYSDNNVTSSHYPGFRALDALGRIVACFEGTLQTSGNTRSGFYVRNYTDTSSTQVGQKGMNIAMDKQGAATWSVDEPDSFRSAIGALSASGGTATGIYNLKSTNIDRDGSDPSSDTTGNSYIRFYDNDGEQIGVIDMARRTDGRQDIRIFSRNENSGTQVENYLQIRVAKDGTKSYSVGDAAAFRNAIGASSGVFPVSVGGSGQSGTTYTTTVSSIATAAANFSITSAVYAQWGKVATVNLTIKTTNAISSGDIANTTVATMVSGKRPRAAAPITTCSAGPVIVGYIAASGNVVISATGGSIAAGGSFEVCGTFVIA